MTFRSKRRRLSSASRWRRPERSRIRWWTNSAPSSATTWRAGVRRLPKRLPTPCRFPGCPSLVDPREGYCPAHKREYRREKDRPYEENRPSAAKRGYDRRWQRIRLQVLLEEPLCRMCAAEGKLVPAEHVDHIDGNVRNMRRENLQPLCASCHARKTIRQDGGFGRPRRRGETDEGATADTERLHRPEQGDHQRRVREHAAGAGDNRPGDASQA
ncbi:MAG: hypothetical protein CWE10_04100 [Symbiobacterium thermophilum]|uniref:HNH nuclease domain-containing protein n=1 Tax=Symbiobacterium thermophilum TaxID=2734 RepID=A0A953LGM6_SYMTR|nr:hypothetical protein [Symbiobacterium thermophilum]